MITQTVLILAIVYLTGANQTESTLKSFRHFYQQCSSDVDVFKCLKIRFLRVLDTAARSKNVTIIDGIHLLGEARQGRDLNLNLTELDTLDSEKLDGLIANTSSKFLETHKLQIDLPKLVEEGRRRRRRGGGALLWALAIKGSFLAMAYQGIAVMSGVALIVGKISLLLSAILGLKKLVSSGKEKTTFEIVKVPKYSESHTSYEDDDHYRRSFDFGRRISSRML